MKRVGVLLVVAAVVTSSCAFKESAQIDPTAVPSTQAQPETEGSTKEKGNPKTEPLPDGRSPSSGPSELPSPVPSQSASPAPSPSPSPSPTPVVETLEVSILWEGASSLAKRKLTGVLTQPLEEKEPISIPAQVPDSLVFRIDLPKDYRMRRLELSGEFRLSSDSGAPKSLKVSDVAPVLSDSGNQTGVEARLTGLRTLLASDHESIGLLKVGLKDLDDKERSFEVRLPLSTPPSRLEMSQIRLDTFLSQGGVLPQGVTPLRSRAFRWDLLQVITIKSQSRAPVSISVPAILSGQLTTHFHRINLSQQECSYQTGREDWDEVVGSELYLVPLADGLDRKFTSILNEALIQNRFEMSLSPGEEVLLGIYGAGGHTSEVATNTWVRSSPAAVSAINGCESRCMHPSMVEGIGHVGNNRRFWESRDPSKLPDFDRCRSCGRYLQELLVFKRWVRDPAQEEVCNQCRRWDDASFPVAPGDPGGGCNAVLNQGRACCGFWQVNHTSTQVQAGLQSYPVYLVLDVGTVYADVVFPAPNTKERVPGRRMTFNVERTTQLD